MVDAFNLTHQKNFPLETSQITFLINTLNDIHKQLSSLLISTEKHNKSSSSYLINIATHIRTYYHKTLPYVSEPSNLYTTFALLISLFETTTKFNESYFSSLLPSFQSDIPFQITNIETISSNILNTSSTLMQEVTSLKTKTLQSKDKYSKAKDNLDLAQLKKKKIIADPLTKYDDTLKDKAEREIIASVQEIETIIPEMKNYNQKLEIKKEVFNTHLKDTFELVVLNVFKGLVHLNQLFFIMSKAANDSNNEVKSLIFNNITKKIRNNSINITDYSERKYAQENNVYYEPIHFNYKNIFLISSALSSSLAQDEELKVNESDDMTNNDEDINNINITSLCDSYIYYVETFVSCIRIRKRIVVSLMEFFDEFTKTENEYIQKLLKIQQTLSKEVKSFMFNSIAISSNRHIQLSIKNTWNLLSNYWHSNEMFHNNLVKFVSSRMKNMFENYRKEAKSDYEGFSSKWNAKYLKKIQSYKNEYEKVLMKKDTKALQSLEKQMRKYLNEKCNDFISKNVQHIREKNKKRIVEIMNVIESVLSLFESNIDYNIETTEKIVNLVTTCDIFEDVKEIFSKFFDKFNIPNYETFMDTMKIRILTKIDFEKEDLGRSVRKFLSNSTTNIVGVSSVMNNINNVNNNNNNVHQSFISSVHGNELEIENENEEKTLQNTLKQFKKEEGNNNNNGGNNSYSINDDDVLDNDDNKLFTSSSNNSFLNNVQFVKKEHFHLIDENKINPYQNFKENELKKIMSKVKVNTNEQHLPYNSGVTSNIGNINNNNNNINNNDNNNDDNAHNNSANMIDGVVKIEYEDEELIDKFKCIYKIRYINNPNGILYLTNYKIAFYNPKKAISIPLEDITCANKSNDVRRTLRYIELITKSNQSFLFYDFEDRTKCHDAINVQLGKTHSNKDNDNDDNNVPDTLKVQNKFTRQLYERNTDIANMLSRIRFFERLDEITSQRMKVFENEYKDHNLLFRPVEEYHLHLFDKDLLSTGPVSFVYNVVYNPDYELEEMGLNTGFYESLYRNRKELNVVVKRDENPGGIPRFYEDLDYSVNLFSDINETDLTELLNSVNDWPTTKTYEIHFIHPVKMIIGPDRITMRNCIHTHFISPKCFIVDLMSYGSDFPFADCFVSMTQYRFVTDYKFNRNTGMFNFKTTATINFNIKFIKSCLFEGTAKSEGYKTSEEDMKFSVYENMKNACEKQSKKFVEMFAQISSDYIRKSLHKYKGEVDMEAIEENVEDVEEKIEEKKEEDLLSEDKDKENVNKKDNSNINKNNKNMMIVLMCVMAYFIIQMMLNEQVSVANKAVSLILVGVVGYMMWNNYKENI